MPPVGTKETMEALSALIGFANAIGQSLGDDGKITLSDAPKFLTPMLALPAAIMGISDIPAELQDLTAEEMQQLKDSIIAQFDIPQDNVEQVIKDALPIVVDLFEFIQRHFLGQ